MKAVGGWMLHLTPQCSLKMQHNGLVCADTLSPGAYECSRESTAVLYIRASTESI
ncbi:unnamed protein product [Periconia digitata]|uniref:Uncharacterized protein n=1 Tax=Periconia digitata TaxID=1303443 RepID=A0A9W4UFX1_9PLEO|nr:unnamed protein product [Periconia digitata]